MKILQIIDSLSPGGAERMAVNLAISFQNAGIPNHLIVTRYIALDHSRIPSDIRINELGKRNFFDFLVFNKLFRLVKASCPDIIHAHSTSLFWAVFLKLLFKKSTLIWHDHYGLSDQLQSQDRKLERFFLRYVDGIIPVNEKLERWVLSETSFQPSRIKVISNFPILLRPFSNVRKLSDPIILLQLANFRRQKNHYLAIEALNVLCKEYGYNMELWLAGNTDIEPAYTIEVKNRISSLGLENKVRILGGECQVEDLLEKAAIGLLSSDSEGLPVSLLEYGLANLPVVVTDVGECDLVLGHGEYGEVVAPGNTHAFAESISKLVEDYEVALIKANKFKNKIELEHGSKKFLQIYTDFLFSLNGKNINKNK